MKLKIKEIKVNDMIIVSDSALTVSAAEECINLSLNSETTIFVEGDESFLTIETDFTTTTFIVTINDVTIKGNLLDNRVDISTFGKDKTKFRFCGYAEFKGNIDYLIIYTFDDQDPIVVIKYKGGE